MKNLLSLLAALGLTATAATTVIACGSPKNSVVIKKTALKDLHLKTRLKNSVKNQQAAFASFIELNPEVDDLHDNVQVIGFAAPDYNKEGSLEVQAKTNTMYSGSLTITIPELNKTDIARLVTNTTIKGTENMSKGDAFNAFLEANSSWTNLNDYVEASDFTPPGYATSGSLTINTKPNTEYTGSITIVINAIGQTSLDSLHLNTSLSIPVTNQQAAFDSFIKLNPEVSDLRDNVQVISFTAPGSNQTGLLEVQAKDNSKYSGTLTITIPELNKTDIANLINNRTIQGVENMSEEQAFTSFLAANSSWSNLNDYVETGGFTAPTYTSNGSLTISAKPNTQYTGSITIVINVIGQTSLDSLHLNTSLSIPVTNQQAAFDSFIKLNPEVSDLRDNLEITSFTAPDYNQTGTLMVTSKADTKYTGSLTITIPELNKTDIARLVTNTTIKGTENMKEIDAFNAFLEANSSWTNLNDYVETGGFTAPTYTSNGSLTINTKPNTQYTGSITIVINAIGQKNLADANLETTIAVDLQASQEDAFQAFLDKNQAILGDDLTLDQVELTGFEAPQILANGQLTIRVKTNETNEWTGMIKITIKYILAENNFSNIAKYLSNQGLLKFQVLAGSKYTGDNNVFSQITTQFISSMNKYYGLKDNVLDISIVGASEQPSEEELNQKGLIWHRDTLAWINLRIRYLDGRPPTYNGGWNVTNVTIETV